MKPNTSVATSATARTTERVYVKVALECDKTGYMQPMSITWTDGRLFKIDKVKSHRPAGEKHDSRTLDCYTIEIRGVEKHLYYERASGYQQLTVGRWFVECPVES